MPTWFIIILDIAIFWFFFGSYVSSLLRTKLQAKRFQLKEMRKQYKALLKRDEDIITASETDALKECIASIDAALKSDKLEGLDACIALQLSPKTAARLPREKSPAWLVPRLEMLIVAVGLAFGIRALFIQPFKIPTGSMQPTLYGVHYEKTEEELPKGMLGKFFSFLNFSRRNMELEVANNGYFEQEITPVKSYPLFPKSSVSIGGVNYILPGEPDRVMRVLYEDVIMANKRETPFFAKGEKLLHGFLSSGDHLFVNRTSLCFREPRRGDIMVFVTDGLKMHDGRSFGGRFYIKRLVGLPGDELLIRDHKLWVKAPGDAGFRLLDASDDPGFERVHSCKGYYHGYANMPGSLYLKNGSDSFKVPEGHYFMLGDNSENSLDSRYWGTVPRRNLVGTACFVWWPFSRRWGLVDRVDPLPIDTPPSF